MRRLLIASVLLVLALGPGGTLAAEEASPAATFGPEHLDTLATMSERAKTLLEEGDYTAARDLQEQVLEAVTRIHGPEHPETVAAMNNMATVLLLQGDLLAARDLLYEVREAQTRIFGPEHPAALTAKSNLAFTLAQMGDLLTARDLFEQVLEARGRVLGPEHPDTLGTKDDLANVLAALGDADPEAGVLAALGGADPEAREAEWAMGFMMLVFWTIVFGAVGYWIATQKGRSEVEGAALGCLLGPIGWIIEAVLPAGSRRR
jgi:hypothetical protein